MYQTSPKDRLSVEDSKSFFQYQWNHFLSETRSGNHTNLDFISKSGEFVSTHQGVILPLSSHLKFVVESSDSCWCAHDVPTLLLPDWDHKVIEALVNLLYSGRKKYLMMIRTCLRKSLIPHRNFSTSLVKHGGAKAKRRKKDLHAMNPQLAGKRSLESTTTTVALEHFDEFYGQVYGRRWHSMRLALISRQKYAAVLNNFGDAEETSQLLAGLGCLNVTDEFLAKQKKIEFYNQSVLEPVNSSNNDTEMANVDKPFEASDTEVKDVNKPETSDEEKDLYVLPSLDPDDAKSRLIDPDEQVLSGGESDAMYSFVPTSKLKGVEDFVEESDYYDYYEKIESVSMKTEAETSLSFPKHLKVFAFPRGNLDLFPTPAQGMLDTINYYCMDAASLLPVLALGTQPGDRVLDMCCAPGGKALVLIQTLLPGELVCNDIKGQRLSRVASILGQFLGGGDGVGGSRKNVKLSRGDARDLCDFNTFDRVLCDVPCFSDRHSVTDKESEVFSKANIKNRLQLPELQTELLKNGLLQLKVGGSLVYSTCTLSPIQNDGVVQMAMKSLWETTDAEFVIKDLTQVFKPFRFLFKFADKKVGPKYGQLILPFLPNNFGPMYIAKITRKA